MERSNTKYIGTIGLSAFLVMLCMAVFFYQERTVFIDIAYHLFFILKENDLAIQNYRFGAFFTQLFPLIGGRMGLSLTSIALLYSCSFVVLYASVFIIILKGIKDEKMALCYLLFSTLMVRHTFYWVQSELPQAAAFAFLYFALLHQTLQRSGIRVLPQLIMILLLVTIVFSHPLMIFLLLFVLLFFWTRFPAKKKMILVQLACCFTVYAVKSLYFKTPYDTQAGGALWEQIRQFPHYLHQQSNKNLLRYLLYDYYFVSLMLGLVTVYYLSRRKYKLLLLSVGFFGAYSLMINLSEPNGADQFYIENRYLFLSAFVLFPFVFDILPSWKPQNIKFACIAALVGISLVAIYKDHKIYTERLAWYKGFLNETKDLPNKKLVVKQDKVPKEKLLMLWGVSYEMWLLSTMQDGVSRSIIVEENEGEFNAAIGNTQTFQTKWGQFDYKDFPAGYFRFTDTTAYVRF